MRKIYSALIILTLATMISIFVAVPVAADPGSKVVNVTMCDGVTCGVQGTLKTMPDETISGDLCWTLSNYCWYTVRIKSVSLESMEFPADNVAVVSGTFTVSGSLLDFSPYASAPFQLSFVITDSPDGDDTVQVCDSSGAPVTTIDSSMVSITIK
jgi:hypothetical protein